MKEKEGVEVIWDIELRLRLENRLKIKKKEL